MRRSARNADVDGAVLMVAPAARADRAAETRECCRRPARPVPPRRRQPPPCASLPLPPYPRRCRPRRRPGRRRLLGLVLRARRTPAHLRRRRLFRRCIALDDVGLLGLGQHADECGPSELEIDLILFQKGFDQQHRVGGQLLRGFRSLARQANGSVARPLFLLLGPFLRRIFRLSTGRLAIVVFTRLFFSWRRELKNAIGHRSADIAFLLNLLQPDVGVVIFQLLDKTPSGVFQSSTFFSACTNLIAQALISLQMSSGVRRARSVLIGGPPSRPPPRRRRRPAPVAVNQLAGGRGLTPRIEPCGDIAYTVTDTAFAQAGFRWGVTEGL